MIGVEEEFLLVDITTWRPAPVAPRVIAGHLQEALEEAGDLDTVQDLVTDLLGRGTGAARQREAYRDRGRLDDVVHLLADRTVAMAPAAALG